MAARRREQGRGRERVHVKSEARGVHGLGQKSGVGDVRGGVLRRSRTPPRLTTLPGSMTPTRLTNLPGPTTPPY